MKLTNDDRAMLYDEYMKLSWASERSAEYFSKKASCFAELRGFLVVFDKPSIETRFCFGEHGYDYDEVVDTCHKLSKDEAYFMAENIRRCEAQETLDAIHGAGRYWRRQFPILKPNASGTDGCRLAHLEWEYDASKALRDPMRLSDEELAQLEELMLEEVAKFEKRLRSYLKRYGMSKCHFWTYWADR